MKNLIKSLVTLQEIDTRIIEKRFFIDKVPLRIYEVDEPLKQAKAELEKMKQKTEALSKKKREKEQFLEETNEKIRKMKGRVSEIKTNKEYQAHLREIETSEKEITALEDEILTVMEELDAALRQQKEKEEKVNREVEKINAFKKELDREVEEYEKELASLKEERAQLVTSVEADVYGRYMTLLKTGGGVAVTPAKNELCTGCNMQIPPQLYVEIRKNEEIIQCPQCLRILYYSEDQANPA
ncbi:MAG: C4-type zinc ribbon domain-containing protein [Nitrospiraceae bacterium]|nr:C4-type zinc ribbon domain-containing protein [Nitrospiraceae bacterium]